MQTSCWGIPLTPDLGFRGYPALPSLSLGWPPACFLSHLKGCVCEGIAQEFTVQSHCEAEFGAGFCDDSPSSFLETVGCLKV